MDKKKSAKYLRNVVFGTIALIMSIMISCVPVRAEAATESQKEQVKQMMIDMYYSADTSTHNVYNYSLKKSEFNEIYDELQLGEHERMIGSYEHYTTIKATSLGSRVLTIKLVTEDYEALERYKRVNENADVILAGIEPQMDDLDKVIYLHDAIVELVTYNKNMGGHKYTLGGALGDKNAVCMGYAEALNLLLKESGFETDYVKSESVNHGWSYVKLDEEWYHIDSTWDDTKSPVKGQTSRQFLLRNEAEFEAGGSNSHGTDIEHTYGSPISTSSKYLTWFMHDVVGKMAFEDGLWYFVDPTTKDIVRADADGSGYEMVIKYTGATLAVVDMEGTVLTYTAGGNRIVKDISLFDVEGELSGTIDEGENITEEEEQPENTVGNVGEVVNPGTLTVEEGMLGSVNLNDYNRWCEGKYDAYGAIANISGWFSTTERYGVPMGASYSLVMKDTRFRVVVFEYAEDGRLLAETELESGNVHQIKTETTAVGLSMYMPIWKNMSLDELVKKLKYDLHTVELILEGVTEDEREEEEPYERGACNCNLLEGVNLCDYNLWCTGIYTEQGSIEEKEGYFSTNECYQAETSGSYTLTMKDTRFKMIVYEYAEDGSLIAITELSSGDIHTMRAETCHFGLSMYMPVWKNMPWDDLVKKLQYNLHSVELTKN